MKTLAVALLTTASLVSCKSANHYTDDSGSALEDSKYDGPAVKNNLFRVGLTAERICYVQSGERKSDLAESLGFSWDPTRAAKSLKHKIVFGTENNSKKQMIFIYNEYEQRPAVVYLDQSVSLPLNVPRVLTKHVVWTSPKYGFSYQESEKSLFLVNWQFDQGPNGISLVTISQAYNKTNIILTCSILSSPN